MRSHETLVIPCFVACYSNSYGGRYAPLIASTINKQNKKLTLAPIPGVLPIDLASVLIGNGLTEPLTQFASVPEYACEGPFPVFPDPDGPQCQALRSKVPTCQRLVRGCYNFGSKLTWRVAAFIPLNETGKLISHSPFSVPAGLYCWSQLYGSFQVRILQYTF